MRPNRLVLVMLTLPLGIQAFGQQSYVGRYDAFGGYTYLSSPHISLGESGFHLQVGVRPRTWYSLGFDYSVASGQAFLTPELLTTPLQQQLGARFRQLIAAGIVPSTYALRVPIDSATQNFAAGPQVAYRRWGFITLYLRPSVGAVHETATPRPGDPIAAGVIAQLLPSGKSRTGLRFMDLAAARI